MHEHKNLDERRAKLNSAQHAELSKRLLGRSGNATRLSIRRRSPYERVPLSFAQQRMWFLSKLDPGSTTYHLSGGLRFSGSLDVAALHASLKALVARHASLRTVFREDGDGGVEQLVLLTAEVVLHDVDLRHEEVDARDRQLHDEMLKIFESPFDLTKGPLVRFALIRSEENVHSLIVAMHHIVSDAQSTQIILNELPEIYRSILNQQEPKLPELLIDYADYALWHHEWQAGADAARQLNYWTSQLAGGLSSLTLATDRPRKARSGWTAAVVDFELEQQLIARLRQRVRSEQCTIFVALLAAFQALLYRYTGTADICTGVPVANRNRSEVAGVVGFFVNTQVLRTRLVPRASFNALLHSTKDAAIAAQANQDVPFDRLVEMLQPERSMGRHPLFQVMFNHLQRDDRAQTAWTDVSVARLDLEVATAPFELTLETCEQADGRIKATFKYADELFDRDTIERASKHYVALIKALADHPEQPVDDVDLLGIAERNALENWSSKGARYSAFESVHGLIEKQVLRSPDSIALIFGDQRLNYAELNVRANRLAHRLISVGIKPEMKVGVALERSIEMVVVLLAILKAGGAYVPLDPEYPAERLAYIMKDSGVEILVTHSLIKPRLPHFNPLQAYEVDRVDLKNEPDHNPLVLVHGENLAYVIYTSGSTGRPKGAQLCHRNVTRLLSGTEAWFQFGEDDVWTMFHSFAFDFSVWEIFGSLCTGGRLVVVPYWVSRSPKEFADLLLRHRVTVLNQTPSAFMQLMGTAEAYDQRLTLRFVIFGGEALDPSQLLPWSERWGSRGPQLINMYGITETTVHVTYRRITQSDMKDTRSTIGTAIPDLGLRVMDASLNLAPIGKDGELYIAGDGLSRGYLGRAALSAERFVADPYDETGGRLYRTGDLVRWISSAQLEFRGRLDDQIKVRGFRIELGEIETQLIALEGVRQAVVVRRSTPTGDQLLAYVCLSPGKLIDGPTLREKLNRQLPDYMVPSSIIVLDALPLSVNGKIDRKALPEAEVQSARGYEAPRGKTEETIAKIWTEVLGVERVGRSDNFFELGGHSLAAARMVARIQHLMQVDLGIREIFVNAELAAIALVVDRILNVAGKEPSLSAVESLIDDLEGA